MTSYDVKTISEFQASLLCRLKTSSTVKKLFLYRWFQFNLSNGVSTGFCPDIYNLRNGYSLEKYLHHYLLTGVFPGKSAWNGLLKKKVWTKHRTELADLDHISRIRLD